MIGLMLALTLQNTSTPDLLALAEKAGRDVGAIQICQNYGYQSNRAALQKYYQPLTDRAATEGRSDEAMAAFTAAADREKQALVLEANTSQISPSEFLANTERGLERLQRRCHDISQAYPDVMTDTTVGDRMIRDILARIRAPRN